MTNQELVRVDDPATDGAAAAPPPPGRVAVTISGVTKTFVTRTGTHTALSGIDLDVRTGEFLAIVGPSGCGKTTLLRIVGGLLGCTSGTVELARVEGAAARTGFVFQEPNLLPWRTAQRNVELPLEGKGMRRRERAAVATDLLRLVGLEQSSDRHPRHLSGGMKQRVAIARALASQASLLLLDEPFAALDAQTREEMNSELQRIWLENHVTAILVTHSLSEAVFLADRIVLMAPNPGRMVSVEEIAFPRPRTPELTETVEFNEIVARLRRRLSEVMGRSTRAGEE